MVIREGILALYSPLIKRIRNWVLPLILILLVSSAYGKFNRTTLNYFSAIELTALHFYLGCVLGLVWLILLYNVIFNLLTGNAPELPPAEYAADKPAQKSVPSRFVNTLFHILLLMVCLSGLIQYGIRHTHWHLPALHQLEVSLIHTLLAWLFISTALVKYYLSFTKWALNLLRYLRED